MGLNSRKHSGCADAFRLHRLPSNHFISWSTMKRIITTAAALALASAGVVAAVAPSQAADKPTLTVGMVSPISSWEASAGDTYNRGPVYELVYDTLLARDVNGDYVPNLATKYVYNADQTQLTLTIRKGVKFADGDPVTGSAVVADINAFKSSSSPQIGQAIAIDNAALGTMKVTKLVKGKKVTKVVKDPYSVIIKLSKQDPALLNSLTSTLGMVQSPTTLGGAVAKAFPIGSGPYTLDAANSKADSVYTFVPNTGYWNKSIQRWGKIVVKVITDSTAMTNALTTGQVDIAPIVSVSTIPALKNAGLSIWASVGTSAQTLTLMDRDGSMGTVLKDVRVRQAINYALDRPTLLRVCGGGYGVVTSSLFPPTSKGYDKALANYYSYDPAKAKQLMAAAGVTSAKIPTLDVSQFNPTCWAAWKQMLADIGITLDPQRASSFATVIKDLQKPKWPMFWFSNGTSQVDWEFLNAEINRDAAWNGIHYGTATSDKLIETIRTSSGATQAAAMKALNKEVTQDAWFAPFFSVTSNVAYNAKKLKLVQEENWLYPWYPRTVVPVN